MTRSIAERENALRDAIGSLEHARNDAVKANEAKSQFLSNMSHELRTPLNAILGFSEVLHKQMMGPIGAARYVEYARHIYESGSHLLVQVEEMLDLSQAADGRLLISRTPREAERTAFGEHRSPRAGRGQGGCQAQRGRRSRIMAGDRRRRRKAAAEPRPTSSTTRSSSRPPAAR